MATIRGGKPGKASAAPARSKAAAPRGRVNTLGLPTHELEAIYNQLDGGAASDAAHRRHSARLTYRIEGIGVDIIQPGGGQTHVNVACRNLSRTGLGFLHSSYVHVGTGVVATLTHRSGAMVRVSAKVVRCRHVTRHVHDVGLMFDAPVDVRDFMEMDPLNQTFTCEVVDPTQLKGTVLIIAEYRIEQACVQSMLRDTALDFIAASTIAEGLEQARKGVGIILCDDAFDASSGVEFVAAARKSGVRCPMILMSADTSPAGLTRMRKADADAFLAKPLKQDLLLRAVAEFLLVNGELAESASPMYSTLPANSPMLNLADDFVDDLRTIADKVETLMPGGDAAAIRKLALRVGGPASSLGFESVAKLGATLVTALDATKCVEQSVVAVNTFIAVCRSARKAAKLTPGQDAVAGSVEVAAHSEAVAKAA